MESTTINGKDTGEPRVAAEPVKTPVSGHTMRRSTNFARNVTPVKAAKTRKFTVTFYSQNSEPDSLPTFPYAVVGTVLGHTKFLAYVEADDPQHASYGVNAFFEVAQVESVNDGHQAIEGAPLRGTIATARPLGFFGRLFSIFGG